MKALREARGLSVRELAARVGLRHVTLLKIEAAQTDPRLGTPERLVEALEGAVVDFIAPTGRGKRRRT